MHVFLIVLAVAGAAFVGLLVGCLCAVAKRADEFDEPVEPVDSLPQASWGAQAYNTRSNAKKTVLAGSFFKRI